MFNPSYLMKSRYGVFYLRWPMPKHLHPQNKPTTLKFSLQTRNPRKALRLCRSMSEMVAMIIEHGIAARMNYEELRRLVTQHFHKQLEIAKQRIMTNGPLSEIERQGYDGSVMIAQSALELDQHLSFDETDDALAVRFLASRKLDNSPDQSTIKQLVQLLRIASRDYSKEVLEFNRSLESIDFGTSSQAALAKSQQLADGLSLQDMISSYTSERKMADSWAPKTVMEKEDHMALLVEILGPEIPVADCGAMQAKRVKDIISRYPRNRNKNALTRGKSLDAIAELEGMTTIGIATINKYLQSYNDLFEWGRKQGHVPENRFSGLAVKQRKDAQKGKRSAYSNNDIRLMLDVLSGVNTSLVEVKKPYQKWGPLIGIYTGARLNEICQLETADIREDSGIWCIDINDDGDRKHLKTEASKRLVPIHPQLISLGFLDYVTERRAHKDTKLFAGFSYSPQNGWGRNLGRWFNERFLPALKLKTKEQTFHSLRHTVNTRLLHANVEPALVKSVIGHEQDGMTHKQYFGEGHTIEQRSNALKLLDYG